ncbi:MAG: zf-TFIIB domain-containing protein [Myxococcales bacterium]|nr:zf-TFIIB domain-containing protein [Myxococcales bacterium]
MTRPSENEEEYFLRQELEKRREAVKQKQAELADEEKARLKELHWMHCAKCGAELHEVEFRGVKVDKCFACGGVYLDDGELEQLVGRPGWFDSMIKVFR